jgi:hypothetical protein
MTDAADVATPRSRKTSETGTRLSLGKETNVRRQIKAIVDELLEARNKHKQ